MHRQILLIFLSFTSSVVKSSEESSLSVENSVHKLCYASHYLVEILEDFNDKHLGSSEWGKFLSYEDIKPKIDHGRGLKKMSMALLPLIFHIGASSTWMVLTAVMAAKSVAIGLLLLVFKIAVSSAKVASFFTLLKSKHAEHHEYSWAPHGTPTHSDWSSYPQEWSYTDAHKSIPMYRENEILLEDTIVDPPSTAEKKNG